MSSDQRETPEDLFTSVFRQKTGRVRSVGTDNDLQDLILRKIRDKSYTSEQLRTELATEGFDRKEVKKIIFELWTREHIEVSSKQILYIP